MKFALTFVCAFVCRIKATKLMSTDGLTVLSPLRSTRVPRQQVDVERRDPVDDGGALQVYNPQANVMIVSEADKERATIERYVFCLHLLVLPCALDT